MGAGTYPVPQRTQDRTRPQPRYAGSQVRSNKHTELCGKEALRIEIVLVVPLLFRDLLHVPAIVLQPLVDVKVRSVGDSDKKVRDETHPLLTSERASLSFPVNATQLALSDGLETVVDFSQDAEAVVVAVFRVGICGYL